MDDTGIRVTPATVPAGQLEVTVVDRRRDTRTSLSIGAVPPPGGFRVGTQLVTRTVLRTYDLHVVAADGLPVGRHATLSVTVPDLAAQTEPLHVVTVDLATTGMMTPNREARREQPLPPQHDEQLPMSRPWTRVAAGATDVFVHNHTGTEVTCRVAGATTSVGSGRTARMHAALAPGGTQYVVLTCGRDAFDFWID